MIRGKSIHKKTPAIPGFFYVNMNCSPHIMKHFLHIFILL